jgi:hypothetical protein
VESHPCKVRKDGAPAFRADLTRRFPRLEERETWGTRPEWAGRAPAPKSTNVGVRYPCLVLLLFDSFDARLYHVAARTTRCDQRAKVVPEGLTAVSTGSRRVNVLCRGDQHSILTISVNEYPSVALCIREILLNGCRCGCCRVERTVRGVLPHTSRSCRSPSRRMRMAQNCCLCSCTTVQRD